MAAHRPGRARCATALAVLGIVLQVLAQPSLSDLPLAAWRAPLVRSARLFAQGIPLALVLFVFFPRLAGPLWSLPADAGARSGLSDRMAPGTISELSLDDSVAFRVEFDSAIPPPAQRYWRGPVLAHFNGREWSALDRRAQRTPRAAGRTISYWITLEPHWKPWLLALEMPASAPLADVDTAARGTTPAVGVITDDQRVFTSGMITQTIRYRMTSVPGDAYPAGPLLEAQRADNLQLPTRESNPRTIEFARALRTDHPDDADFVRAALRFFRTEPFFYTLAPPLLPGPDSVDAFLFDSRRGFCEHYASSFVVLARAAGIPARVVTGYQGGELNPTGGYLIVRQSDAHAWAEVLIGGQWRRVDPTAAVAPSRIERGLGGALPSSEFVPLLARLDQSFLKDLQLSWDAFNYDWRRHVIGFNYTKQRSLWRDWNLDRLPGGVLAALVATLSGVWGVITLGVLAWWRRRSGDRARVLWDALCRRLATAGLPRQPSEGPLAYGARASTRWPEFAVAFQVVADSYAQLRYGPAPATPGAERARAVALAGLARAIALLPAPAVLRALQAR